MPPRKKTIAETETAPKKIAKPRVKKAEKIKKQEKTAVKIKEVASASSLKFIYAVGRRKTAVAQIKIFPKGAGKIEVNGKKFEDYFPTVSLQKIILSPLEQGGKKGAVDIAAKLHGGGIHSQAESLRLAISRALIKSNAGLQKTFRGLGLLTRDSRIKERKKPGLKRARRAPQWQKR